jgi:hypothetical protein
MRALCDTASAWHTMPPSFTFRDLRCFADPTDALSYYFLPMTADVQRDSRQQPMITTLDVGSSAYVMFTATWRAASGSVDALRQEIATGHQDADGGRIRLSFAPVTSPHCHAMLGDDSGASRTIATSTTSGVPPYDALFNLSVAGDQLTHVRNALRGQTGFLAIEYVADLLVPATAAATFRSDAGELLPWLRDRCAGGESVRDALEHAVEAGMATVTIDTADHADEAIAIELFDRVLSQAAQVAPRWIAAGGYGDIDVGIALERNAREPIRVFADIGGIVGGASRRRA